MIFFACEHYQHSANKDVVLTDDVLTESIYSRYSTNERQSLPFFEITKNSNGQYECQTHYYVGLDWIIENKKAIFVAPKQNNYSENGDNYVEIDHLKMLFEALEEPLNIPHLKGLCEVDFHKPMIPFPQAQDELSIFLVIEYLQVLRHLVKKGLKKQYYQETKPLNGRVKGKIAVAASMRQRLKKQLITHNVCTYQVFGVNHDENKLLKKAYRFATRFLEQYPKQHFEALNTTINYIRPAFSMVDDDLSVDKIKSFKPNPFYKDYGHALELAQLLLKRFAYNSACTLQSDLPTPPYWINMAQLFELYVFKKLKESFPESGAVKYHEKIHYQELDFILNTKDKDNKPLQMVVDAKYKPRYTKSGIQKDDARQLSGYTRLKKVYNELGMASPPYPVIDALIIHPDHSASKSIDIHKIKKNEDSNYVQFFKLGIQLPER